jgi:serine/alanine adding enzyme
MNFLDISQVSREEWMFFVSNHPNGNIFQSPLIYDVYNKTENYNPAVIFCKIDDELVGVMQSVIISEGKGIKGYLTARLIVQGGPLVKNNNPEVLKGILQYHIRKFRSKAIYTQIRNLFSVDSYSDIFTSVGFSYEDHLDIHIDLSIDFDIFWRGVKQKLRQNIRKSEKLGVEIFEVQRENIDDLYNILNQVYNNANLPVPPKSLFTSSFDYLLDSQNLIGFVAKYEGKVIGFRLELVFRDVIYDWYAGSLDEYYHLKTNDLLPFKAIEWGYKRKGFRIFDFGGAGKPNIPYGVRDHKLKFWNELINLGRFQFIHKPVLYKIMVKLYKIVTKIKGK